MNQSADILDFIKKSNLPDNAKFLGYAAWLPHSEQFLVSFENIDDIENYIWSVQPKLPYIFDHIQKAERFVRNYDKGAIAVLLFDLGNTYWFDIHQS